MKPVLPHRILLYFFLCIVLLPASQQLTGQTVNEYYVLGQQCQKREELDKAAQYYEKVVVLDPNHFDAHLQLGAIYKTQEQLEQAEHHYRAASNIQPEHMLALLELGNALNMMDHCLDALEVYSKALHISPQSVIAMHNFGFTLKKMGHIDKAITVYEQVVAMSPTYALARFNLGVAYLTVGDFERGWQEYEYRWHAYKEQPKEYGKPTWKGESLEGKVILVYAEQGLGDTYQFVRYVKILKEMGAKTVFLAQRPLTSILKLCPYIDCLVGPGEMAPPFDYQIPLMSLPLILNTRVETIPAEIPYLFADEKLVTYWKNYFADDHNLKVGICWQGNKNYQTQALRRAVKSKSLPLEKLASLSTIEGVSVYSLQMVTGLEQFNTLDPQYKVTRFSDDFDRSQGRFMDTAAVMKNLDLMISIDTSSVHLAGGLGIQVWNILPEPADWRWFLRGDTSPWYPDNMRLIRQKTPGDWDGTITTIYNDLTAMAAERTNKHTTVTPDTLCERDKLNQQVNAIIHRSRTKKAVTKTPPISTPVAKKQEPAPLAPHKKDPIVMSAPVKSAALQESDDVQFAMLEKETRRLVTTYMNKHKEERTNTNS